MSRVVHFEIPADDPGKWVGFYEKVFGWNLTSGMGQWRIGLSRRVKKARRASMVV